MNEAIPTTPTIPPSTTTITQTTAAPQSPFDCNFEQGTLCSTWSHDPTGDFQWILKQGSTPSINTGPTTGL